MVAYRFEDSRSGDCVARHLEGYRGILQIHGYTAYNRVARPDRGNDGALLAGCWAHSRRRLYELHANDSSKVATATIERMGVLWSIEEKVRGQSPDVRVAARLETSAAVVADLYKLSQDTLPRISGKSKLAEAIRYALSRREAFERFLHDGRTEIDSNIVERAIRPHRINLRRPTPGAPSQVRLPLVGDRVVRDRRQIISRTSLQPCSCTSIIEYLDHRENKACPTCRVSCEATGSPSALQMRITTFLGR